MPNELPALRTNPQSSAGTEAIPRPLWRFRVTELITPATPAQPDGFYYLVKARTYKGNDSGFDATQQGPKDYIVALLTSKPVGKVFHAAKVEGGLGSAATNAGKPVFWVEVGGGEPLPKPTQRYQVYTPIDDTLIPIWTDIRFPDG
jgi:hypothetical protein